ncbi:MAG: helix-turn-helix domain-containing protein [Candidatus Thermoplasmatota archaeon]|nr:helix-turn-helix domain-containing protein [Candidatus Thermoplasmatota archaeon]
MTQDDSNEDGKSKAETLGPMVKKVGIPYHKREKVIIRQTETICFMRKEGFSVRQIAEYLGVSDITVYRRMRAIPWRDRMSFERLSI